MPEPDWQRASSAAADRGQPSVEVATGPDGSVYMRESGHPDNVVVTTRAKWEAFVKGVKAGEFDDFAEELAGEFDEE